MFHVATERTKMRTNQMRWATHNRENGWHENFVFWKHLKTLGFLGINMVDTPFFVIVMLLVGNSRCFYETYFLPAFFFLRCEVIQTAHFGLKLFQGFNLLEICRNLLVQKTSWGVISPFTWILIPTSCAPVFLPWENLGPFRKQSNWTDRPHPIPSMYGIFTYIYKSTKCR